MGTGTSGPSTTSTASTLRPFDKLTAGKLTAGKLTASRLGTGKLRVNPSGP